MTQKIALVTGASSGIGKATAKLLAKNGYYVFAAARRMYRLEQIRSEQIEPVALDVTDEEAVKATVNHIISTKGRIDVLVNNAAFCQLGAIECVSMEAAHRQFEAGGLRLHAELFEDELLYMNMPGPVPDFCAYKA